MPITKEQQAELAGAAGEQRQKGPKVEAKALRFNGATGELRKVDDYGEQEPIAIPVEFVILKKRNALKAYIGDVSHFTSEYDYSSTIINLFKFENGKASFVTSGTPAQLREAYPELSGVQVAYVVHDHELCKLEIAGKSFGSFIDYQDELKKAQLHSYQVVTQVTGVERGKKGIVSYAFMKFGFRDMDEPEFTETKEALEKLTKELYEVDKFYAEKNAARGETVVAVGPSPVAANALPTSPVSVQPVQMPDIHLADEVNPEDIPF